MPVGENEGEVLSRTKKEDNMPIDSVSEPRDSFHKSLLSGVNFPAHELGKERKEVKKTAIPREGVKGRATGCASTGWNFWETLSKELGVSELNRNGGYRAI